MGGGISRPLLSGRRPEPVVEAITTKANTPSADSATGPAVAGRRDSSRLPTAIDARIVATLRQLNLTRRAGAKTKAPNFERIVLKFALAREAFVTINAIYDQFADVAKGGLDFDGLKEALSALGAQMEEVDMREIFYESDMVRDNSLSQNEFVISLAIAHLLGLITNFDSVVQALAVHMPEDITPALTAESATTMPGTADPSTEAIISPRDTSGVSVNENGPELIAKALDLMITAYLLFDADASGTIQTNEVLDLMKGGGRRVLERKPSSMPSRAIRNERIKELDFDNDGTITFQEFVLTFQRWVGVDE